MNTGETLRYFATVAINRGAGAIAGANRILSTQVAGWILGRQNIAGRSGECDLRVGGKWRSDGLGADGTPFHVSGEYLEYPPPRLLVHTWVASYMGELKTTVRWELKAEKGGTQVTLRHRGFAGNAEAVKSHGLWRRARRSIPAGDSHLQESGNTLWAGVLPCPTSGPRMPGPWSKSPRQVRTPAPTCLWSSPI